jgi:hypothetical protein
MLLFVQIVHLAKGGSVIMRRGKGLGGCGQGTDALSAGGARATDDVKWQYPVFIQKIIHILLNWQSVQNVRNKKIVA